MHHRPDVLSGVHVRRRISNSLLEADGLEVLCHSPLPIGSGIVGPVKGKVEFSQQSLLSLGVLDKQRYAEASFDGNVNIKPS